MVFEAGAVYDVTGTLAFNSTDITFEGPVDASSGAPVRFGSVDFHHADLILDRPAQIGNVNARVGGTIAGRGAVVVTDTLSGKGMYLYSQGGVTLEGSGVIAASDSDDPDFTSTFGLMMWNGQFRIAHGASLLLRGDIVRGEQAGHPAWRMGLGNDRTGRRTALRGSAFL